MSCRTIIKAKTPQGDHCVDLHKASDAIRNFLTMPRTKKKTPNHCSKTIELELATLLAQMAIKEHPESANRWLELIGKIIYAFLEEILNQETDRLKVIEQFIFSHKADKGAKLFRVSATTVNADLIHFPRPDADRLLSDQVGQIENKLRKQGLWASNELVAIDPSDVVYRGKYHNQYTPWAYCGQKELYKRSYKEVMMYLNPGSLIASSTQDTVLSPHRSERDLPLYIAQGKILVTTERARGTKIRLFEGDREYYNALGFAYSRFGLWDTSLAQEENPRFLCPMKLWENSGEKKWNFLLDPQAPIVEETEISLDFYQEKFLGSALNRLPANSKRTKHMVPTAAVAVFDAYPNKHDRQSIEWAHDQASKIARKLADLTRDLTDAETDFVEYLRKQQQLKWRKGSKKSNKRKISRPTYNGRRRTIFKDKEEQILYRRCCAIYDRIQEWKKRKEKLCKRLMFFMISLYENESIIGKEEEFSELILEYHERWAIEIGFKVIKYQFFLKTNSRSACGRHARWIMGCLVYNAWHYWRLTRAGRKLKQIDPTWKPFENSGSPPIRKKYERKVHPLLTAQGYLLEELEKVLKNCIKIQFQAMR
jgi:hypothetical protein